MSTIPQFGGQPSHQYEQQQHPQQRFQGQPQQVHQQVETNYGLNYFLPRQGAKDLPKFDGNSMDENVIRLQQSLHGPAKDALKALLVLPHCVNEIMETLHKRFGRDEFIIKGLISKTRRIAAFREGNPQSLIEISTTVNNMIITIKSLDRFDFFENPQLLTTILYLTTIYRRLAQ